MESNDVNGPPPTPSQRRLFKTDVDVGVSDADMARARRVGSFIEEEVDNARLEEGFNPAALCEAVLWGVTGLVAGSIPRERMAVILAAQAEALDRSDTESSGIDMDEDLAPDTPSKIPKPLRMTEKGLRLAKHLHQISLSDTSPTATKSVAKTHTRDDIYLEDDDDSDDDEDYEAGKDNARDKPEAKKGKDLDQLTTHAVSNKSTELTGTSLTLCQKIERALPRVIIGISANIPPLDVTDARQMFINGLLNARKNSSGEKVKFDPEHISTLCNIFFHGLFTPGQVDRLNRMAGYGSVAVSEGAQQIQAQQKAKTISKDGSVPQQLRNVFRALNNMEVLDKNVQATAKDVVYLNAVVTFAQFYDQLLDWAEGENKQLNPVLSQYLQNNQIVIDTGRGKGKTSTIVFRILSHMLGNWSDQTLHNKLTNARILRFLVQELGHGVIGLISKRQWVELTKVGKTRTSYAAQRFVEQIPDAKRICAIIDVRVVIPIITGYGVSLALLEDARRGTFLEKLEAACNKYKKPLPTNIASVSDEMSESDPDFEVTMQIDKKGRLMTPQAARATQGQTDDEDVEPVTKSVNPANYTKPACHEKEGWTTENLDFGTGEE